MDSSEESAPESSQGETPERRSEKRTKSRVERTVVGTLTDSSYGSLTNHFYILDISPNGMRINLDRAMEPESEFELSFGLDSLGFGLSGELTLPCSVVWQRSLLGGTCVLGVKFGELEQESQDKVEQLLEYWSNKHDFELYRLSEPVDAKIRSTADDPWSKMVGVRRLSSGGFQFSTSAVFENDQEIEVRLLLESGTVETRAVVRWCEPMKNGANSVGCEFLELSPSGRGFIDLHLRRKS